MVNRIADVAGVPEVMIDHFSKRLRDIRGPLDEVIKRIDGDRVRLGLSPVEADSQESPEAIHVALPEDRL